MYQEMLLFVENLLKGKQGGKSKNKIAIDYDRFAHTKRVLKWVKYLCNELNVSFDRENLYIAAIFMMQDIQRKRTLIIMQFIVVKYAENI